MSSPSDSHVIDGSDALPDIGAAAEQENVAKPRCVIAEVWAIKGPRSTKNAGYMHINAPVRDIDGRRFVTLRMKDEWLCKFLTGKCPSTYPVAGSTMLATLRHAVQEAQTLGTNEIMKQSGTKSLLQAAKQSKNFGAKCAKEFLKSVDVVDIAVPSCPGSSEQTHIAMLNDAKILSMEQSADNFDWMYKWVETETRQPKRQREEDKDRVVSVFFNRSDSSWYCRGPLRTKRFKVQTTHQDNTPFTGEEYKAVLGSRREEAVHEMNEQQAGRATIADDIAGVVEAEVDAVTGPDAALIAGYGFVAELDSVDMAVDMESATQRDLQPPSSDDENDAFGNSCVADDDPFA